MSNQLSPYLFSWSSSKREKLIGLLILCSSVFCIFLKVLGVSFSPNGYHLASGGEDNLCRIWDLRMRKSLYIIPAHSNLISQVKFEQQEGYFLVTASYDMKVKV